ncbi:YceI family protein [Corynebacterium sp.]|uniref:YceI family protein n=1 Tax=Corynebacterium sp. TaxID=1720 RepID=UPI0026DF4C63|nr:YceI family protein [Corynebacterium sp.]MDO5511164.1 YceI family protein [Corynebacterium sp.]
MTTKSKPASKIIIAIFVILIVLLALVAVVPMLFAVAMGPGVKTEGLKAEGAEPASTDIDGEWQVAHQRGNDNTTSVGFTFFELLPSDRRETSGSTQAVEGWATIEQGTVRAGEIIVDMDTVSTDNERRDINVRRKIFHTDEFPTATFTITEPADVSDVPADGTPGKVTLNGDMEIRGETRPLSHEFDILRDGDRVVLSGDVLIDRNEYGVESPEFVAAKIDDTGELNIRILLEK